MSRHLSILHRRPRTRRERIRIRLHRAHHGLSARWAGLHAGRHARATEHRVEELLRHLTHEAHAKRPAQRGRAHMPQLRHHHR